MLSNIYVFTLVEKDVHMPLKDTVYQYLTLNNLQIAFYQRQLVI
jgi:hypothetical protein